MGRLESRVVNSVRLARQDQGLTQAELASIVDVSRQTIVALERGNYSPSIVLALRLAVTLGRRVDDLFALPADEVARIQDRIDGHEHS